MGLSYLEVEKRLAEEFDLPIRTAAKRHIWSLFAMGVPQIDHLKKVGVGLRIGWTLDGLSHELTIKPRNLH